MRFLDHDDEDDPLLSVVNLIDLFLVVIGILLIVIVQNPLNPFSQDKVFEDYPSLYAALRIVGGAYLLYLAWQIATTAPMQDASPNGRPFGFWKAAGFQWVNPKAWIMAIGAITAYLPTGGGMQAVVLLALLFALVNAPSVTVWVTFGTALRRWLTDLRHLRVFNVSMAMMLVLSLYPLLFG